MNNFRSSLIFLVFLFPSAQVNGYEALLWPGYTPNTSGNEQYREIRWAEDARAIVMAPSPDRIDQARPTLLVIYATPNGNTAEQTLGCRLKEGMDWHFDIQHAAAQWRQFSSLEQGRSVVLACVQANTLSWPSWKSSRADGPKLIRQLVESLAESLPVEDVRIVLTGHSGGGSFLFGYIDASEEIPSEIERIAFLDANYGFAAEERHGEKLARWLESDPAHHLVVLAYDDREIELDGKKVVGPSGGTFRATKRMLDNFHSRTTLQQSQQGDFIQKTGFNGKFVAWVHPNPDNIILHTRMVGEMNGLLAALAVGTPHQETWGYPQSPRAYASRVDSEPLDPGSWQVVAPAVQPRPENAPSGSQVVASLLEATPEQRESAIVREVLRGNVPNWWRRFVHVTAEIETGSGEKHKITYRVSPDYLAVGSDLDFVRMPMTPYVAQNLADMLGCVLPTLKMVDEIHEAANVKLAPQPLTIDRESLATFVHHHKLIQDQMAERKPGEFVSGIKKDVVISNKLQEDPGHVAIYGWHQLDGKPIQPLTTIHIASYVDYSHGIRLVDQWGEVDGKPMRIEAVLRDENLCHLLSDEGPILEAVYQSPKSR